MRIAVITASARIVGGLETYLANVLAALAEAGHQTALLCQGHGPPANEPLVPTHRTWTLGDMGRPAATAALRAWQPEVLYTHGLADPRDEAHLLGLGPTVHFAHGYWGVCISLTKTHTVPAVQPCQRRFGPGCLFHFFPRRCGGLNPLRMLDNYRRERQRTALLARYARVLTASDHMRAEYARHGARAMCLPLPVSAAAAPAFGTTPGSALGGTGQATPSLHAVTNAASHPLRLVMAGRLETLKGVGLAIAALPAIVARLGRPVRLTIVGDGPARPAMTAQAQAVMAADGRVVVDWRGWQPRAAMPAIYADNHLLVVPSLWPEPFGLVGPEAGLHGLPAVAFDVGGIADWLVEGVNGHLAPGNPPTMAGLVSAVCRTVAEPAHYQRLCRGARDTAAQYTMTTHLAGLMRELRAAATGQIPGQYSLARPTAVR